MTTKKKLTTALVAVLLLGVVLAVVLLGVFFGTREKNGTEYFKKYYEVPIEIFPESKQITVDRTEGYLGHPDLVSAGDGKLLTMYPLSHGKGQLAVKTSGDNGATWSERVPNAEIPASFAKSQETPTLYRLEFTDGSDKLLLVSGCPRWDENTPANGFNCSVSTNDGANWTEFENFYGIEWGEAHGKPAFDGIVAMSSLTRLKENGAFVDKWMGTFHDHDFVNYKTILTFDEEGNPAWTEPAALLPKWRQIEQTTGMCEIEIVRTPDADGTSLGGDMLVLLARANNRVSNSMIAYSDDEGKSWTEPKELPRCLTGDRHKAEYDPKTKTLTVSFRSVELKKESALSTKPSTRTMGWVVWIGGFGDLLSYRDAERENDTFGKKAAVLGFDYSMTADCGYAGTALDRDGNFAMISYGRFEKKAKVPYIMAVRFRVSEDGTIAAL